MTSVLIGVLSAQRHQDRRTACLTTWMHALPDVRAEVVFLIGNPALDRPQRVGQVLECPCPDIYDCLPQKTRWFCKWGLSLGRWTHFLKCDDDTYVSAGRLLMALSDAPYVGHDLGGFASGGAGYVLNARAAAIVADTLVEPTGCEDVLVGSSLARAGVTVTSDGRFHPWNDRWPQPSNDLITSHYCTPDRMRAIHQELVGQA